MITITVEPMTYEEQENWIKNLGPVTMSAIPPGVIVVKSPLTSIRVLDIETALSSIRWELAAILNRSTY